MTAPRALALIGAVQVLTMLVALGRAKVLSILLGPAGYGVASTVDQTVVSLVQLGGLSLPLAAMKFLARSHSESDEAFRRTFAIFFRTITGLSGLAVIVGGALFVFVPEVFGADVAGLRGYFLIAMLGVPATMLNILFIHTLAAAQRGGDSAWLNMLFLLVLAMAAVIGVLMAGLSGLYALSVLVGIAATAATIAYLRASLGVHFRARGGILAELRKQPEILSYALLLYSALATYSLVLLVSRYFVFNEMGSVSAGHLQALLGVALTLAAVPNAMSTLFLAPLVNRRAEAASKVEAADRFCGQILLFLVIGAAFVVLFPRFVLTVLFSSAFAPAAGALAAFITWQLLHQVTNVYAQLLVGLDDVACYAIATCAGYVLAGLLMPLLIPRFGLAAVGLALSIGMIAMWVTAMIRLRVRWHLSIGRRVWLRVLGTAAAVSGAYALSVWTSESSAVSVLARMGYFLGVGVMILLALSPAERELAVSAARFRWLKGREES